MDAVFRSGTDTFFLSNAFNELELWWFSKNTMMCDGEENKEFSDTTASVSERPIVTSNMLRNRPIGRRIENMPEFVHRSLFDQI